MPPRETVVVPLGLVTEPNEYGQYPAGALSRADNLVLRSPGLLSQLPERTIVNLGPFLNTSYQLYMTTGLGMALAFVQKSGVHKAWWYDCFGLATGPPPTIPPDAEAPFEDTYLPPAYNWDHVPRPISMRGRVLVEGGWGIVAGDYLTPTTTAERTLRYAGLPQPILWSFQLLTAPALGHPGLALQSNDVVTYAATIERKYADGYILISDPSPLVKFKCPTGQGPADVRMIARFGAQAPADGRSGVRAGDVVKIWRSMPQQSASDNINTESGTTLYLTRTYTITAFDLTLQVTDWIVDDTEPRSLTSELYTNPGQESLQGMRRRPPKSKVHAVYQGATWYANTTIAPFIKVRIPSGLGDLSKAPTASVARVRERGIGMRILSAGSVTAASAIVTGISAADIVGIKVGQALGGQSWADGKTVVAVGGTSFTMSAVAGVNASAAGVFTIDQFEIDGTPYPILDMHEFLNSIGMPAVSPTRFYTIYTDETVAYRDAPGVPNYVWQCVFNQGFSVEPFRYVQTGKTGNFMTVRATNGQNYDPPLPNMDSGTAALTIRDTQEKNRGYWSWDQQPEAVAPGNSTPIGKDEIIAAVANRDALWFFCTDGLYRVTGYLTRSSGIGAQWSVELVDPTFIIAGPRAYCVLRDQVFAYGSLGFVGVSPQGVRQISAGIVGNLLFPEANVLNSTYYLTADDKNNDVWIGTLAPADAPITGRMYYVYNAGTKAFTTHVSNPGSNIADTAAGYAPVLGQMAFLSSTGSIVGIDQSTVGRAATLDYQPVHDNDPLGAKQWIDMVAILNKQSADQLAVIAPRFNGSQGAEAGVVNKQNDARANFGVPRNAPAIGHTLAPGLYLPGTEGVIVSLRGVSLRYQPLSEQQVFRQAGYR